MFDRLHPTIALVALIGVAPVAAQDGPPAARDERADLFGLWEPVDEPADQPSWFMEFGPDGYFARRDGGLIAASYRIEGDFAITVGGDVAILPGSPRLPFDVRGDTLLWGADPVPAARMTSSPPRSDSQPLLGRWRHERHGLTWEREFTSDGRIILWRVDEGDFHVIGDRLRIRIGGSEVESGFEIEDGLLRIERPDSTWARFRQVPRDPAPLVRPTAATDPSLATCRAVGERTDELLESKRILVEPRESRRAHFHFDTDEIHFPKGFGDWPDPVRLRALAHAGAHALGFGTAPETDWVAERIARSCSRDTRS